MANGPQIEDGFLRIANELYDAILAFPFTARQLKVVLSIMRKTYGFGKKQDDISASQIGAMCGMSRNHATSTLNQLAGLRVITKIPGVYGSVVGINKDYKVWVIASTESVQVSQVGTSPESVQGVPEQYLDSPELGRVDSPESGHTKDNFPKDNKQKKKDSCANADAFARFWSAYPNKKSKGRAQKAFEKLNPNEQLLATILEAIERAKTSVQWTKNSGEYIPHPASWLNAAGWEDEFSNESGEFSFAAFVDQCKAAGEKAISEYQPLLAYVEDAGLPMEFVSLAWLEFKRRHLPGGPDAHKVQADWRQHFVNCVSNGWYKLWYANAEEGYGLTTVGIQAQRLHDKREAA
ncbi:replication protein [Achromobacter marplatensis]|uniref:replication protein n=1 Tax=Achromobacter marplatensis TaxID=470868 RepID=UPI0028E9459F|nr:replication protein [Achromobacter marplatensis]